MGQWWLGVLHFRIPTFFLVGNDCAADMDDGWISCTHFFTASFSHIHELGLGRILVTPGRPKFKRHFS
jgi:hypothetical protein